MSENVSDEEWRKAVKRFHKERDAATTPGEKFDAHDRLFTVIFARALHGQMIEGDWASSYVAMHTDYQAAVGRESKYERSAKA